MTFSQKDNRLLIFFYIGMFPVRTVNVTPDYDDDYDDHFI